MNIIYIAHTKERIWRDTYFSILTLLKYAPVADPEYTIWLFTDNPDYFDFPGVNKVQLTPQMLEEWYGEIQFIHRQKLMAIRYVADRSKGDFLMLDGDVFFRKDPMPLFKQLDQNTSIMHLSEGKIRDIRTKSGKKLQQLADSGQFKHLSLDSVMYNAGVIGFAEKNLPLEDEVLSLTEELYRAQPMHIMEQLAHSVVLGHATKLLEAADYIYHWWGRGKKVEPILIEFFEKAKELDTAGKIELAISYTAQVGAAPFNDKKGFFQKLKDKVRRN